MGAQEEDEEDERDGYEEFTLTETDEEKEAEAYRRIAETEGTAPAHWYNLRPYEQMSALGSGGVQARAIN